MFDKKYIAVFLQKEQNSYSISKIKRFTPKEQLEGFPIDIGAYTYTKRLKVFYFIDLATGNQINLEKSNKPNIDVKVIDDMLCKGLIRELTKDMTSSNIGKKIFDILTGAVIGGLISFIISAFVFGGFNV